MNATVRQLVHERSLHIAVSANGDGDAPWFCARCGHAWQHNGDDQSSGCRERQLLAALILALNLKDNLADTLALREADVTRLERLLLTREARGRVAFDTGRRVFHVAFDITPEALERTSLVALRHVIASFGKLLTEQRFKELVDEAVTTDQQPAYVERPVWPVPE